MSLRRYKQSNNIPAFSWIQFFAAKIARAKIKAQGKPAKEAVRCRRIDHRARYLFIDVDNIIIHKERAVKENRVNIA